MMRLSALDLFFAVDDQVERPRREVGARHRAAADVGAEPFGLLAHVAHELVAVDPFGVARVVIDFGGGGQLAARFDPFVEYGVQVGARGVDGRRISGRAAADNQTFDFFHDCYAL